MKSLLYFFRFNLQVKLIDFSCAVKVDGRGLSEDKEKVAGTVEYSAPEVKYYSPSLGQASVF